MYKKWGRYIFQVILLNIFILLLINISFASMSCNINTACLSNEVELMELSSPINAVAASPTENIYSYKVCCDDIGGILDNSATFLSVPFIKLSSINNAHGEEITQSNYPITLSIKATENIDQIICSYKPSCQTGEACLFSFSSTTNAHFGGCNSYSINACCSAKILCSEGTRRCEDLTCQESCDYTPNYNNDIDSDGIPNNKDDDIDNDGTPNDKDDDIDNDNIDNDDDDDIDGDGLNNDNDNDIDDDGTYNYFDKDIDGDNIDNIDDVQENFFDKDNDGEIDNNIKDLIYNPDGSINNPNYIILKHNIRDFGDNELDNINNDSTMGEYEILTPILSGGCNYDSICQKNESCSCFDCFAKQSSCEVNLRCDNGLCSGNASTGGIGYCGDGYLSSKEDCDDGNWNMNDSCVFCKFAYCGDGYVHEGYEDCDDGRFNGLNTFCNNDCYDDLFGTGINKIL